MASIDKRPDGRYRARWREYPGGPQKTRQFNRKGDADRFLDGIRGDLAHGRLRRPCRRADPLPGLRRGVASRPGPPALVRRRRPRPTFACTPTPPSATGRSAPSAAARSRPGSSS